MDTQTIPINLRRLRSSKGLTQTELAERIGITRVAYRKIESGESEPRVSTLQNISEQLGVKIQELLTPVKPIKAVRFRALKKMTNREDILARISLWLEDFNELEEILGDHKEYKLKGLADSLQSLEPGKERARAAAHEVRKRLGLGDEPVRDICGLLESCGIKVYTIRFASVGFFGLSIADTDGGPAIVLNVWDRIPVERWIFSAAHELGHLLLHLSSYDVEEIAEDGQQEDEASIFASHFLMPEKTFQDEWHDTSGQCLVSRVLKVKRIFRVSYRTVLYRLDEDEGLGNSIWGRFCAEYKRRYGKTLGGTDEPLGVHAGDFSARMAEGWAAAEPDKLSRFDFAENRLSSLVRDAVVKEEISMGRGAEILGLSMEEIRELAACWDVQ